MGRRLVEDAEVGNKEGEREVGVKPTTRQSRVSLENGAD